MIRIAVIDDEPKIRRGIEGLLETSFEGRAMVNCFKSASDLIRFSKKEKIDILVTDICMPDMDGLELGNYLKMFYPQIQIIIISGYGNFEYAQAAITLQVCEYLLKPVDPDKLLFVMNRIVEKIERDYFQSSEQEMQLSNSHLERNMLIGAMLYGKEICAPSRIPFNDEKIPYWILICENETDWCVPATKICYQYGRINECRRYYLFVDDIPEDETLKQLFRVNEIAGSNLRIGISGPCYGAQMLNLAYMQAVSAIKQELYDEKRGIWRFKGTGVWQFDSERKAVMLMNCIFSGKGFITDLDDIKEEIRKARPVYPMFEKNMVKLFDVLAGLIENNGIPVKFSMGLRRVINTLDMYRSLDDLFEDVAKILAQVAENAQNIQSIRIENRINKAIDYIKQNYNKDLTLEEVAVQADLNSSYFSSYFKKHTGTSFINYITELRIKKAKEMLKDESKKIGDIAEMLGFNDTRYFSKIFKKYVGVTPSEYRNITGKLYD